MKVTDCWFCQKPAHAALAGQWWDEDSCVMCRLWPPRLHCAVNQCVWVLALLLCCAAAGTCVGSLQQGCSKRDPCINCVLVLIPFQHASDKHRGICTVDWVFNCAAAAVNCAQSIEAVPAMLACHCVTRYADPLCTAQVCNATHSSWWGLESWISLSTRKLFAFTYRQ